MKNNNLKCVVLARVSSREQEETGYSLDSQKKLLRTYTDAKDFGLAKTYTISESASGKKQREIFNEMMVYVKKNNVKVIVCEKVDRLTRNLKDAVMIDAWLDADEERQVHLVKDGLILHKNSRSQEKLNWGIRVIFAKNYTDNLSEEVKKGQMEKVEQGWWPHSPKLGYKTISREDSRHKITVLDGAKAVLLRQAFELYATGTYSVNELATKMYDLGLRSNRGNRIVKSRMAGFLSDPYYYGQILWHGKLYKGAHEPLISQELFDRVQDVARRKTTPKYSKHFHVFKGLVRCMECNGTITWYPKKGTVYGRCNHYRECSQKICAKENQLEAQLLTALSALHLKTPRLQEWVREGLKEHHATERAQHEASVEQLTRELKAIEAKIERVYDDKIDGVITKERHDRKNAELVAAQEHLEKELKKHVSAHAKYHEIGVMVYDLAHEGADIYTKGTDEEKRNIINLVFGDLKLYDGELHYKYAESFEVLHKAVVATNKNSKVLKTQLDVAKIFEPLDALVNTKQKQVLTPAFEYMRERRDSNSRPPQ